MMLLCVVVLWISSSFADQNMRESHRRPVIVKVPGKIAVVDFDRYLCDVVILLRALCSQSERMTL